MWINKKKKDFFKKSFFFLCFLLDEFKKPLGVYNYWYSSFLFGFIGNQPFRTRFRWSKISLMVQKEEKENTPSKEEIRRFSKKNRKGGGKGRDKKDDSLNGLDPEQIKEIEKLLKD